MSPVPAPRPGPGSPRSSSRALRPGRRAAARAPEVPTTELALRDTHRLIPSRFSTAGTVLSRLAATGTPLAHLMELDDATNDRFLGEEGLLSGIGIHELVYGIRYAHIVNAAYTHASPDGGRFNDATRGAWYAATDRPTALAEVAFHRTRQLEEVDWTAAETASVDDYLADLTTPLHDLRSGAVHASAGSQLSDFARYLAPEPIPACYAEPQALAATLLRTASNGVIYPSVRRPAGTCLACFRPALVYNVRRGARLELTLAAGKVFRPASAREIELPTP